MQLTKGLYISIRHTVILALDDKRRKLRANEYQINRMAYENHNLKQEIKLISKQLAELDAKSGEKVKR